MGPYRWKTLVKSLLSAAVVAEHYCASLAIRTWSISVNWNATSNGPVLAAISGQQCQPLQELKEEFSPEFSTYKAPCKAWNFGDATFLRGPYRWEPPVKILLSAPVVAEHYCASLASKSWSISVNWNATSNGQVLPAVSE